MGCIDAPSHIISRYPLDMYRYTWQHEDIQMYVGQSDIEGI